jgi:hypothetical protein
MSEARLVGRDQRSAQQFFAAIVPSLTERPSWPERQKKKQRQAERRGVRSIEP